jgi:phospholipid/cholesterol/gamma-HCH transport system substrate-binding protein
MGLLGDNYVEITLGSEGSTPLGDCAKIGSIDPFDLYDYVAKTERVIAGLTLVLEDLNEIETQITTGEGFLHAILYDPEGGELISNLSGTAAELRNLARGLTATSDSVRTVIAEEGAHALQDLSRTLGSVGQLAQKLTVSADSLNTMVEGDGSNVLRNLSKTLGSIDDLAKKFSVSADSLNSILNKIETGEGSLGALINDPTVYEDLKVILGGAKRSKVIKGLIQYTIKKNEGEQGVEKPDE